MVSRVGVCPCGVVWGGCARRTPARIARPQGVVGCAMDSQLNEPLSPLATQRWLLGASRKPKRMGKNGPMRGGESGPPASWPSSMAQKLRPRGVPCPRKHPNCISPLGSRSGVLSASETSSKPSCSTSWMALLVLRHARHPHSSHANDNHQARSLHAFGTHMRGVRPARCSACWECTVKTHSNHSPPTPVPTPGL